MTDLNEFLRNVTISDSNDSLVDEEEDEAQIQIDENAYPLQQRIYGHTTDCYNYLKHDGSKVKPGAKPTGQALLINEVNSLAVVDIDIKKDHDIVREDILLKLRMLWFKLVQEGYMFTVTKETSNQLVTE